MLVQLLPVVRQARRLMSTPDYCDKQFNHGSKYQYLGRLWWATLSLIAGTSVSAGDISTNNLDTGGHGYSGGSVNINAGGTITTGGIDTDSSTNSTTNSITTGSAGQGGSVTVISTGTTSTSGAITIGDITNALGINTAGDHGGGAVNITSTGGSIMLTQGVATNNTDVANGTDTPASGGAVTIKSGIGQVAGNTITIDANTTTGIPIDADSNTQKVLELVAVSHSLPLVRPLQPALFKLMAIYTAGAMPAAAP